MNLQLHIRQAVALLATATLATSGLAADDHKGHAHGDKKGESRAHETKSAHGGAVTVVKDVNYELVAKGDVLQLYVSDHGKAIDLKGATAKVLLLSGTDKENVTMTAAGDRLEGKAAAPVKAGTKAAATVTMPGSASTAIRFVMK